MKNQKFFNKARPILIVSSLLFIASCSYTPGMQLSGDLKSKPLSTFLTQKTSFISSKNTSQQIVNIDDSMPQYYTTESGVNIRFINVDSTNIPASPKLSTASIETIRYLLKAPQHNDYRIAAGDSIAVNLWAYPEIFGNQSAQNSRNIFTISQSGDIFLPLIGRVVARDKTQNQLRQELSQKFAKYLKQPEVGIKIVNFNGRFYSILGKVRTPGEFVIKERQPTLMTALSKSGGMIDSADASKITINRSGKNYQFGLPQLRKLGVSPSNIYIQNGDSIHIDANDNRKVYVIGEVGTASPLPIPESGLSLASTLGQSQGINNTTANPAKVYVVRSQLEQDITQIYRLDLSKLENLSLANKFAMLPNDIVYVDATGLTRWNRVLNQILPSTILIRAGQKIGAS